MGYEYPFCYMDHNDIVYLLFTTLPDPNMQN